MKSPKVWIPSVWLQKVDLRRLCSLRERTDTIQMGNVHAHVNTQLVYKIMYEPGRHHRDIVMNMFVYCTSINGQPHTVNS